MASDVLLLERIDGEVAIIGIVRVFCSRIRSVKFQFLDFFSWVLLVLQAFIKVNAHGGDVNAVLKKIEPCRKTVSFLRIRKTASNLYRE